MTLNISRAMYRLTQRIASSLEWPSAIRRETYSCVFGSSRNLPIAMMWSALLAARSPHLLNRCRVVLPDEAGTGECPIFCVIAIWSILPERSKDDDHIRGTAGRTTKGCERPEDLLGDAGLMKELKIKLMERMLGAGDRMLRTVLYEAANSPLCRVKSGPGQPLKDWAMALKKADQPQESR